MRIERTALGSGVIADNRLDVPVEYRCWTERKLLQEIAELKAEIDRLRRYGP